MRTDVMISQLRREAKKHENDKLQTFDTNITAMCTDVANRLEELENEKKEIRAKTIDEFVRRLKNHPYAQYHLDSYLKESISEIAEQMKAGADNE